MTVQEVFQEIEQDIKTHRVVLFMKGNKLMPQCGFSARVVDILHDLGCEFESRDVLQDDTLRAAIKEYSDWPTLPQLYINGEFIGGCDIIIHMYENGDLEKLLQ